MKKKMNNKILMFWAVLEILDKFNLSWAAIDGFVAVYDAFKLSVNRISKTGKTAGMKTGEVTKGKNKKVDTYVLQLFSITSLISVYATNTNNAALKNAFDYTESEIKDMRPGELLGTSEAALEEIAANLAALTALGLKTSDTETLQNFVDNFETITSATRVTITTRKTAGARLRPQFAQSSFELKEKLDKLMEQFRRTNRLFTMNTELPAKGRIMG